MILDDTAGGAFVVMSAVGRAMAQHLNASGSETWAAGGIVVQDSQTPSWAVSTDPVVCSDGAGGFIVVHGNQDLFAQRVNLAGTSLWGAGITISNRPGLQEYAAIAADGAGGALIGWQDLYWATCPGPNCWHAVCGKRIDAFGNAVWSREYLYTAWTVYDPHDVRVVADGSGGAMFAWLNSEAQGWPWFNVQVRAKGVAAGGGAPKPALTLLIPDAGVPSGDLPVAILGDYLETSLDFVLTRPGHASLPITDLGFVSYQWIVGTLHLAGAGEGGYDLVVSAAGAPQDTLRYAFGSGGPLPCDSDDPFPSGSGYALTTPSPRRAAFDSQGKVHVTWIEYVGSQHVLYYNRGSATGWGTAQAVYSSATPLHEPCLAVGADLVAHLACVREVGGGQALIYAKRNVDGGISTDVLDNGQVKSHPAMVLDPAGRVRIVYEEGPSEAKALYHVMRTGSGFGAPLNLNAGTNARQPDLTVSSASGDLMLAFVRNSWIPGVTDVCYQRYDGASQQWQAPLGIGWGFAARWPSVAWDGTKQLLFAWIAEVQPGVPWLYTNLMQGGVPGEGRFRLTDGWIYEVSVSGTGPGGFTLLTLESDGDLPLKVYFRSGNGNVFFPRKRLNLGNDVDHPCAAVARGRSELFALWTDYQATTPLRMWECFGGGSGIAEVPALPAEARLACSPNPFNPATTIAFALPAGGGTRVDVLDVTGWVVRTLVDELLAPGEHAVTWNGRDAEGGPVGSGVYVVRLRAPGQPEDLVAKVTLLK